ncbi:hypothetical protein CMV_011598 [Castanea mollissima]|uniref:LNS2/PITP domain-containing protein n=1 Tax=Castanea mollissima TaxID=60419 RepID=A0A8J4VKM4_9ROSI|nr:hypothetical protein CMV_011598 [Castanea mollissima]
MYAVGRLGSYITKVSGPFHPFGGAVDIIVVEQQDGSFKSSPWYVRFGKFQGVLKSKEKVVNIGVNGVEANFHMYLDHKGEAYFLSEVDVEEGEIVPFSLSSGDEIDGESKTKNDRQPLKSKSYNFENSVDKIDVRNGKVMTRSGSRRSRMFGLVFGRRSMKEEDGDAGAARADSLARAEIAADLLEVRWSTNLGGNKPRKDKAEKDVQINDGKGQVNSSVDNNVENGLDQCVLHEETGSHNEHKGDISVSSFENTQRFVDEARMEVPCFSSPEQVTKNSMADENVLEEKCEMVSMVSRKIDGDIEHDENSKVQCSIQLEEHPGKHIDEEQVLGDVLTGCELSREESETDRAQSFIYCEASERLIVAMNGTSEQTSETMYLVSEEDGEVHINAEMLHPTTELASEDTVTLQVAEDDELQTETVEVSENHSQQLNPSHSCIHQCNVMDLEEPLTVPETYAQMVTPDQTLGPAEKVESQTICTISSFSNSGHQVQDEEEKKDGELTSKFQSSLESIGDCLPPKAISTLSSASSEEGQFPFNDLEEFQISEVQHMESISPENLDKESPSFSPDSHEIIEEVNGQVNENNESYSSSENFVQENPQTDLEIEKSKVTSSPIIIPRSHKVSGKEVGRLVESLPNLWSHTENPDAHDVQCPLRHSLDSRSISLNSKMQGKDDSSCIRSDKDSLLAGEQSTTENTEISGEPINVLAIPAVGDPSKFRVSPGGSWRIWPFSLRRSKSRNGMQPAPNDARVSGAENASESTTWRDGDKNVLKPKVVKRMLRALTPTSEQLASLNLKDGKNTVTFTFSTAMLGKQQVDARIYLWKWNTRIVISDVDGTITKSDVLGQFMPMVGVDWSQTGVAHLYSAIKENGYQLLFLSARAISQAYHTRQFLFNLKQDGKALPDGPVVISPDGIFPSLYREVIRRAPHEFKVSCLEDIKALFPSDCNPFYAGFGNRDTDEFSYIKVGIPKGKIFIINPKGEVAVNRRIDTRSYSTLHALVNGMFPPMSSSEQEDFNSWNYWRLPPTVIDM